MASVLDLIKHYQHAIEKYPNDEQKILKCIDKLFHLGVTVQHLQETGVGRTVNALRKEPGDVGQAARALVYKWKRMVASEESDQEGDHNNETSKYNGHEDGDSEDNHRSKYKDKKASEQNLRNDNSSYGQRNGDHSKSTKRKYNSSEEDEPELKKTKSSHPKENGYRIKKESESKSERSNSDNESEDDSSDSDSESDASQSSEEEKDTKIDKHDVARKQTSSHNDSYRKSESNSAREKSIEKSAKYNESLKHSETSSTKDKYHTSSSRHKSSHESKDKDNARETKDRKDKDVKKDKDNRLSEKHKDRSSEKEKKETHEHSSKAKSSEKDSTTKDKSSSRHKSSHKDRSEKEKNTDKDRKHKDELSRKHESSSHHKSSSSSSRSDKHNHTSEKDQRKSEKEKHKSSSDHSVKEISERKEKNEIKDKSNSTSRDKLKEKSSSKDKERKNEKRHMSSSDTSAKEVSKKSSSDRGESSSRKDKHRSSSSKSSSKANDEPKKKSQTNTGDSDDGIDCGSGASFAEALGMVSPAKPKKKSIKETHSPNSSFNGDLSPANLLAPTAKLAPLPSIEISALPEISPNYKPRPPPKFLPHFDDTMDLSSVMSSKNQRTKVYSGNKVLGKIPSLYEMCVQVLQEHIDALEYTGGVPYEILKPVVDRATPQQLFMLEHFNPYLMEDTDHLWQKFCEKHFRNKKRMEMETWREMYMRCQEEQEIKLKSLTENIKIAQEAKKAPIKQTKMAYVDTVVKPPRNIARKQAQHGTAFAATASPAARVASLASAPNVLKGGRPAPVIAASSSSFVKPKKAPLMQKALQFMRGRKR